MDKSLAKKFVEKKLITETTEVVAKYRGSSISGDINILSSDIFTVKATKILDDGTVAFHLISTKDGLSRVAYHEAIVEIDGMDPYRFASVYNIKADGADAKIGKRRGRKPKDRSKTV
jgi:hypothetical protein